MHRAAGSLEVCPERIASSHKDRRVAEARAAVCFLAAERLGLTLAAVGQALKVSPVSVWRGVRAGRRLLAQHPEREPALLARSMAPHLCELLRIEKP